MRTATVIFLTLCLPLPVAAEDSWSLSISGYAGRNIVERASLDFADSGLALESELEDALLTNSTSFGGRVTAWRVGGDHRLPEIGFGLDFVTYEGELLTQTVQGDGTLSGVPVIVSLAFLSPISFTSYGGTVNFQARYPIGGSPAFPDGRWFPYVGFGIGAQRTKAEWLGETSWDLSPFFQGFVGINLFLTERVALFTEYKRTHSSHDFEFNRGITRVGLPFDVNHFVAGLAVHS